MKEKRTSCMFGDIRTISGSSWQPWWWSWWLVDCWAWSSTGWSTTGCTLPKIFAHSRRLQLYLLWWVQIDAKQSNLIIACCRIAHNFVLFSFCKSVDMCCCCIWGLQFLIRWSDVTLNPCFNCECSKYKRLLLFIVCRINLHPQRPHMAILGKK